MTEVQTNPMTRYNPNVYEQQILAKGRDLPAPQKFDGKVPARFAAPSLPSRPLGYRP